MDAAESLLFTLLMGVIILAIIVLFAWSLGKQSKTRDGYAGWELDKLFK